LLSYWCLLAHWSNFSIKTFTFICSKYTNYNLITFIIICYAMLGGIQTFPLLIIISGGLQKFLFLY
jgi:hypothetical protein